MGSLVIFNRVMVLWVKSIRMSPLEWKVILHLFIPDLMDSMIPDILTGVPGVDRYEPHQSLTPTSNGYSLWEAETRPIWTNAVDEYTPEKDPGFKATKMIL